MNATPATHTFPPVVAPERCTLCGGRHHERLRADGQRRLTIQETAIHLAISDDTVRRLIRSGDLHARQDTKRTIRILEADVVAFLNR